MRKRYMAIANRLGINRDIIRIIDIYNGKIEEYSESSLMKNKDIVEKTINIVINGENIRWVSGGRDRYYHLDNNLKPINKSAITVLMMIGNRKETYKICNSDGDITITTKEKIIKHGRLSGTTNFKIVKNKGNWYMAAIGIKFIQEDCKRMISYDDTDKIIRIDNRIYGLRKVYIPDRVGDEEIREVRGLEIIPGRYSGGITSISLPKCINNINKNITSNLRSVEEVEIRASTINIGSEAFKECKRLKTLRYSQINKIGDRAFIGLEHLEQLVGEGGPTEIGKEAFKMCKSFDVNQICRAGLIKIKDGAFIGCNYGSRAKVNLPETLIELGNNVFDNNINIIKNNIAKDRRRELLGLEVGKIYSDIKDIVKIIKVSKEVEVENMISQLIKNLVQQYIEGLEINNIYNIGEYVVDIDIEVKEIKIDGIMHKGYKEQASDALRGFKVIDINKDKVLIVPNSKRVLLNNLIRSKYAGTNRLSIMITERKNIEWGRIGLDYEIEFIVSNNRSDISSIIIEEYKNIGGV